MLKRYSVGLKSEHVAALLILGIGVITADFHCFGIVEVCNERLKTYVRGLAMLAAAVFKNQYGRPSRPGAVTDRLSNNLKT